MFAYRQPQYYRSPFHSAYYDDEDEASYHYIEQQRQEQAYAERMRRAKEQRELEEAHARRQAQEEAYLAAQRQQAARARAEEEYRQRVEQQRQRRHAEEKQRRRHLQSAYNDDLASQLFGHLFAPPMKHKAEKRAHERTPSPEHRAERQPSPAPTAESTTSAAKAMEQPSTEQEESTKAKMDYDTALRIVQSRGKQALLIRRRLRTLRNIQERFDSLKGVFVDPARLVFAASTEYKRDVDVSAMFSLDFNAEKSHTAPVLAFTPLNRPLQAYEEALTRLLVELDDVPSQGSTTVKTERKQLVRTIEAELARLDALKVDIWNKQRAVTASLVDIVAQKDDSPAPSLVSEDAAWDSMSSTDVGEANEHDAASMQVADELPSEKTLQSIALAESSVTDGAKGLDEDSDMKLESLV